ncbi:VPLPA-CTERM-specific exosortase XrtD [Sneathiella glossodoripedis]|uniref:VPLPA-CTERM-specific exosortase XrtD n=1 Tax=Sneathiella glossodoripedis TaxID=418853 RepID=UPI000472001C|nr:VPLPA-CTERM-specific exosortase XrtD [Sneathiella glossodoripedis]
MTNLSTSGLEWPKLLLPLTILLVLAFYMPDAHLLWDAWMEQEEFSHGPLMLAVSIYLLWARRELLSRPSENGRYAGVALALISIAAYALAIKSGVQNLRHLSTFSLIFALFLTFGGWTYARYVFPSIILLPFVVPPPSFLNSNLSYGLQLFSSDVSVFWLRSIGITVFQDGNIIDLGKMKLEVAEACSGLRYLYPMIGLGALSGMLFDIHLWKRGLFLVLAAAVSIIMNSVRIFLTGAFVEFTDMGVSEGFFHLFEGWVFFLISFALTLGVCWLTLTKAEKKTIGNGVLRIEASDNSSEMTINTPPVIAVIALCIALGPLSFFLRSIDPVIPERATFASFPLKINGMIAEEDQIPGIEQEILQMSDYFLGHYREEDLAPISLFIGYYEQQSAGQTPHSPRVCIPSGGWKITDLTTIELNNQGTPVPVNRVMIGKGEQRLLVYYWFQQRGKYIANEYMAKFNLLVGGLVSNRTDGALVRLTMPVTTEMSEVVADQRLSEFATELFEVLPRYVPSE